MVKSRRAVILTHEAHEGPGFLGPALERAGFECAQRLRSVRREDVDAALVVVMGGGMGVYETDAHPFLADEVALLAERLALGRPCLGICLGAQLLAKAAGAEVFLGKNGFEIGAAPVRWTKEALTDDVIAGVAERTVVAHWHQDTYSRVPGATLLASSDRYVQQAFRLGDSYGFQFHIELSAEAFEEWLATSAPFLESLGKSLATLKPGLVKLRASEPELQRLMDRLVAHFAEVTSGQR